MLLTGARLGPLWSFKNKYNPLKVLEKNMSQAGTAVDPFDSCLLNTNMDLNSRFFVVHLYFAAVDQPAKQKLFDQGFF